MLSLISLTCLLLVSSASALQYMEASEIVTYRGVTLAAYKDGTNMYLEPHIALDMRRQQPIRRSVFDNSWYFRLPVRVTNPGASFPGYKTLIVRSFAVLLRKGFTEKCPNKCIGVSAGSMSIGKRNFVFVRCQDRRICQRIVASLRYRTPETEVIRNAFKFKFFVRASTYEFAIEKRGLPVYKKPLKGGYFFGGNRIMMYTAKANSGYNVYNTFVARGSKYDKIPRKGKFPAIYRSRWLDNLPEAVKITGKKYMVYEFRKAGKVVAQVKFNIRRNSRHLNARNWFHTRRFASSKPVNLKGRRFNYFSVWGHHDRNISRRFYINYNYGGCPRDNGFMIVIEKRDVCNWAGKYSFKKRYPYFVYNPNPKLPYSKSRQLADRVLVYMQ